MADTFSLCILGRYISPDATMSTWWTSLQSSSMVQKSLFPWLPFIYGNLQKLTKTTGVPVLKTEIKPFIWKYFFVSGTSIPYRCTSKSRRRPHNTELWRCIVWRHQGTLWVVHGIRVSDSPRSPPHNHRTRKSPAKRCYWQLQIVTSCILHCIIIKTIRSLNGKDAL